MAQIKISEHGSQYLLPYHRVGRLASSVDTHFALPEISNVHATFEWRINHASAEYAWFVKDDSTNGTWLNGEKIPANTYQPLAVGQRLAFGKTDNILAVISDLSAPRSLLVRVHEPFDVIPLSAYNLVPGKTPQWIIRQESESRQWFCHSVAEQSGEDDGGTPVQHGDVLNVAGQAWQLFLPAVVTPTTTLFQTAVSFRQMYFVCNVSRDEETVDLRLHCQQLHYDLPSKVYFQLLVYLARRKMNDTVADAEERDRGWVKNLVAQKELGLSESHLNIYIHRLRAFFATELAGVLDQDIIVERRRGAIRTGLDMEKFTICGGSPVLHQADPASGKG